MLLDLSKVTDSYTLHLILSEAMPATIEQRNPDQTFDAESVEATTETGVVFGLPGGGLSSAVPFTDITRITAKRE